MIHDCLIVGGGPAGLVAAVYLARFRRDVRVVDAGSSRAALIPVSHNCPGFPEGISGRDLLTRLREQAKRYGAILTAGRVDRIERDGEGVFHATAAADRYAARSVVLATGVLDLEPTLPKTSDAVRRGLIRHCPICDGYEVIGKRVAVIGRGTKGAREALFIRHFSAALTLFTLGTPYDIDDHAWKLLQQRGITVVDDMIRELQYESGAIVGIETEAGKNYAFDTIYSALGCKVRSEVAETLGVRCDDNAQIVVDDHLRTNVPRVYAVGDVANDLNQIAVAAGHAAIAATAIHNELQAEWSEAFVTRS